ncbi:flagellar M-ring protein [Insulibacter thermoxylanivorax]|uniref:Flagellar M-ring protein n=1 Tax=Insulibacter thermoxylanivorax TaxID=2749268 RepID=A0A916QF01_9BACL|nr:flagellar basal-body MS-ring/collar protein FliF [Insulibacter thermoxylanivorax]GFR37734.1 flagellar M-ring protein [Insulibacter thermoxylanivorax]
MNEKLIQYRRRAFEYWNRFSRTHKILIVAIVALMLITIAIVVYNASRTEYSVAFKNLDQADAAAIKNFLDERGIPYEFTPDMSAVGVPTSMVTEVKAAAIQQNLIHSGSIGFGIFRENIGSFGMTENQFQVLKVDALAGEIEKLLFEYQGVVKAKAVVNLPTESAFINTEKEQQASVAIQVRFEPGFRPEQKQIDSMYRTVQMTLPSLPMENIIIADPEGQLIPSFQEDESGSGAAITFSEQMRIKRQIEEDIRSNVEGLLRPIMGHDSVVASVFATVNFDKKNSVEHLVTPVNTVDQKGIEISLQEIQKSFTTEGAPSAGGIVGTGTGDIANYPAADAGGGVTNSEEFEQIVNYEVNRITNEIVRSPYAIMDLTINVGIEPPDPENPDSLTQEMRDAVQRLLVNIVGAALANNGVDYTQEQLEQKVLVFAQPFRGKEAPSAVDQGGAANAWWLYSLAGAAAALLIGGGAFAVARRRRAEAGDIEYIEEPITPTEVPAELPEEPEPLTQEAQIRQQLSNLARNKPEDFVNLLRTWLVDE